MGKNVILKTDSNIILTMETAVKGGSVSIFRDNNLVDFHLGDKSVSGSEDLLPKISELLEKNNISKSEIDTIAVSNGPGSFTGIRIGIATAFALQKSLNCNCYGFDLLRTLAQKESFQTNKENIISAVSQGRNKICWFNFDVNDLNLITTEKDYVVSDVNFLINYIAEKAESAKKVELINICADSYIYNALADKQIKDKINLINAGENLSGILAFALLNINTNLEKPRPLYLSETNLF